MKILILMTLMATGCTSMATIQKKEPLQSWASDKEYSELAFCVINSFEKIETFWTKGTALNYRDDKRGSIAIIQGSAKADNNYGIFELMIAADGSGSRAALRAIKDPATTKIIDVINSCN